MKKKYTRKDDAFLVKISALCTYIYDKADTAGYDVDEDPVLGDPLDALTEIPFSTIHKLGEEDTFHNDVERLSKMIKHHSHPMVNFLSAVNALRILIKQNKAVKFYSLQISLDVWILQKLDLVEILNPAPKEAMAILNLRAHKIIQILDILIR